MIVMGTIYWKSSMNGSNQVFTIVKITKTFVPYQSIAPIVGQKGAWVEVEREDQRLHGTREGLNGLCHAFNLHNTRGNTKEKSIIYEVVPL